jgi:streptogramin lyase
LWAATDEGFGEWDEASNSFFIYDLKLGSNNNNLKKIYTDRSGIVWVCSNTGGVYILDPYRQIFKTNFFNSKISSPAKTFGAVNCIFSEADTIWVATWYGNAIYKFDRDFNLLKKWNRVPINSKLDVSLQGNHIFRDRKGYLWFSTLQGLHRFNVKSNSFNSFNHNPDDSTSLVSDRVVKYFEDSQGISWVCFYKRGICKFDPSTGKIYDFLIGPPPRNGRVFYFNTWDIMEDDQHNVWFADDGLGLWKFDRKKNKLVAPENKFLKGHIASVFQDKKKNIWASTSDGLARIHNDSVKFFTAEDGLPSNNIYGAQEDAQGRLWILTNQGLARLDPSNDKIRVFKEEDGLERINEVIFQKLCDGRMAIGSWHYITVFDPTKITSNENVPPVQLTQFKVFGKSIPWEFKSSKKNVTLQYAQNQFSIDFAVLNYSNPGGNKFYYKMEGFDKKWISSEKGFANYTNLDPGSYTFRVKGASGDGVMNEAGDLILIKIIPPFWATWWFLVVCVSATASIIYIIYRIRLNQILRLEGLRSKISTDLHDDMGSTLSSISILSEMALKANESTKYSMLSEIKDNSVTLMERMDDIVWSINPRNDSFDRLMLRVQNFASKLFEAKGIEYQIEVPENISNVKLSMENRQHVYLIMKEAINNLVKYSESKCAKIKVTTSPLMIEISDEGKGFDLLEKFEGNGIQSMRNRAKMMKAELSIESNEGKGSSIFLKIK